MRSIAPCRNVILDLNLPKYHGTEVLKMIRASSTLSKLPVIVLSSWPEDAILREIRAGGVEADCYFTKPPDFEEFLFVVQSIRECFEKARARHAPAGEN